MSDGHPRSCKVREACQHPICPSTCLLLGSLCFWHCVWSGVWTPMVARCLFQPWLSGLGSSSGAVHCWDAGSAAGPGGGISLAPGGEPPWLLQKYCTFVYGKNHQDWINLLFLFNFHGATLLVHVPCEQSYLPGPNHTLKCDLQYFYVVI